MGPPVSAEPYPFAELDSKKAAARARGMEIIDFGMGEPLDPTPTFIRQALADAITPQSPYPRAAGLPELRQAISAWAGRRFGIDLAEDHVLPVIGTKEIIHALPAYVTAPNRDTVVFCPPAYPVYRRGALFHGMNAHEVPLTKAGNYLPDLDGVPQEVWARTALLWLNYPHNPTGAVASLDFLERAAALARRHEFVLAVDEAYSEIWFDEKPPSALQLEDRSNVVVVNSLSKRSCMAGYRSGFLAGDPAVVNRVRKYRPSVGVTPPEFVQRASVVAWNDEHHVDALRERFSHKRDLMLPALRTLGIEAEGDATFFLWLTAPSGHSSSSFAQRLLDVGVVATPGTAFGSAGEGYCRLALVPSYEECQRALELMRSIEWEHE